VDDRGHYLQIGPVRVPVEVEDAPFVIVRVEREGDGLTATRNDLGREPLAVETLAVDARGIPRCRVKDGRFVARLDRAAAYQLLQQVDPGDGSRPATLLVGGRCYPVPGL